MREGIILAAGIGSRINVQNNLSIAKPLVSVDSLALLLRTIQSLELAGCLKIVIVLGHQADCVEEFVLSNYTGSVVFNFVLNENYKLQNGISVLCARPFVGKEYLLTMADHILDEKIMNLVCTHRPPAGSSTLCIDYKLNTIFDIDDATKVLAEGNRIRKIGKNLEEYNCIDTGVFIGTEGLMDAIEEVYNEKGDVSLSEGVQVLANKGLMEALDIKDAFWQDVDNLDMLKHAEKLLRWKSGRLKRSA
jgi:choline kinase